ncbi:CBS domain containing protein [Methanocaldococcus lauensis]|uniref:CBS domain containing protein n=1 Tax=Methanocaldococcus lauensis TaxID=2546128 RepID=A0A8D6PTC7_9EURY|nr:CBS domain-containing protein [Methanocaldococcus lauensis]CAB3287523.1 CBS domain containing protein [Methanocaldococcus lauensis]CAB3288178.1 CBS domain containing protein [Methanocaldococcus lauensis]
MISKYLVRDIMKKGVVEVSLDTKLCDVIKTMAKYDISSVVVSDGERFWGIITDTDILKHYHELDKTAEEIMSVNPITISPEAPLEKAIDIMVEHNIHHLYVKSPCEEKIVGVLSSKDIIKLFSMLID